MLDALSLATNALGNSASRIANATSSIVKASSTGDITTPLVQIQTEKTLYSAEAKVIKTVAENQKKLLDVIA